MERRRPESSNKPDTPRRGPKVRADLSAGTPSVPYRRALTRTRILRASDTLTPAEEKSAIARRRVLRELGYTIASDNGDVIEVSKPGLAFRIRHEQDARKFADGSSGKVVNITATRAFGDEATILIWDQGKITFQRNVDGIDDQEDDDVPAGREEAYARADHVALHRAQDCVSELIKELNRLN